MPDASLSEVVGALVILAGLTLSFWALVDDAWDVWNVWRFGEVGGPRWVSASEHFLSNITLLVGWLCMLGLISIAIYLPPRTDAALTTELTTAAGWLRLVFLVAVLISQVHRRIGRLQLQRLPLESWARMISAMFDGLDVDARAALTGRLLRATHAGRELGHAVANDLQGPITTLDLIAEDATMPDQVRIDAAQAVITLDRVAARVNVLHQEIKALEVEP